MRSRHVLTALILSACASEPDLGTYEGAVISDAVHANGTGGFYWLPPMVSAPSPTGVFEPAASPTIQIVRLDTDATIRTLTPTVGADQFQANWDTKADNLSSAVTYRIRALVPGGRLIGIADVDVVDTGAQVKGVDTAAYVALVDGRTLPIKFRIEHATVDADADGALDWTDNCPQVANATQADSVGDGTGDACRCASLTCAAPDACHVAACSATAGCVNTPVLDGTSCGAYATCQAGACTEIDLCANQTCAPSDACHVATCDPHAGCGNAPVADGTACGAGQQCELGVCTVTDVCVAQSLTCTPSDACHVASCDPVAGCQNTAVADGTVCGAGEQCQSGACTVTDVCVAQSLTCTPSDACHSASCDPVAGCQNTAVTDGTTCGAGQRCEAGVCTVTDVCVAQNLTCTASNTCHVASCDPMTGCAETVKPDGSICGAGSSCHGGVCTADRCDPVSFGSFTAYADTGAPQKIRVADMNEDGHPDIVSGNYNDSAVEIFLNHGDGTFASRARFSAGNYVTFLSIGDVNNDGHLDAVVPDYYVEYKVNILLGDGQGHLATPITLPTPTDAYAISTELGDANGDGNLDLAVGLHTGRLRMYFGDGTGHFAFAAEYDVSGPFQRPDEMKFSDIDHDGDQDLVVANQGGGVLLVMKNLGGGTYGSFTRYPTGNYAVYLELADLDGDGQLDAVIGDQVGGAITTYLGASDGTFNTRRDISTGNSTYTSGIAVADFDGDHKLDVVATSRTNARVPMFAGNGDGSFTYLTALTVPGTSPDPLSPVAGDFDGDGHSDVALLGYVVDQLYVTLNACP